MLVTHMWPGCPFQSGDWNCDPVDAYFVGFTEREVKAYFPDIEINRNAMSPEQIAGISLGNRANRVWFLVGADGSFCDRFSWEYPISNQWNGYNPFIELDQDVEIDSLDELQELKSIL